MVINIYWLFFMLGILLFLRYIQFILQNNSMELLIILDLKTLKPRDIFIHQRPDV